MPQNHTDQLALSIALTAKTRQICLGLESGAADILELVTPTTAELLLWWFGDDMVMARGGTISAGATPGGLNFHVGQKQAILNVIVAHEVLGQDRATWSLLDLYRAAAPAALLSGTRLNEVAQDKHAHPKYCFKMATGTGKTWVLQALLIWQMLNKTAALAAGQDDARFTRQFMVVAPGLIVYERLLD
ncbi:MAG: DEAD/DEAH box helicase family protein, partial [Rhodoferax sp.]